MAHIARFADIAHIDQWFQYLHTVAGRCVGFEKFTPCFRFGKPKTAKKKIQRIPYSESNSSNFARLGPAACQIKRDMGRLIPAFFVSDV